MTAFSVYMGPYHDTFRAEMLSKHWPRCLDSQGKPVKISSRGDLLFALKYKKTSEKSSATNVGSGPEEEEENKEFTHKLMAEKQQQLSVGASEQQLNSSTSKSKSSETTTLPTYEDSVLTIAMYLVNEEICRNWLTQGFHLHEIESLCIMNAPLKRAILCIDPMDKLKRLVPSIKLKDQDVVEIDISQRYVLYSSLSFFSGNASNNVWVDRAK